LINKITLLHFYLFIEGSDIIFCKCYLLVIAIGCMSGCVFVSNKFILFRFVTHLFYRAFLFHWLLLHHQWNFFKIPALSSSHPFPIYEMIITSFLILSFFLMSIIIKGNVLSSLITEQSQSSGKYMAYNSLHNCVLARKSFFSFSLNKRSRWWLTHPLRNVLQNKVFSKTT
jgi:hypothetical protein